MAKTFAERRSAFGVIRAIGFESAADLGADEYSDIGHLAGHQHTPTIDTAMKPAGSAGSLRFDIDAFNLSNAAGLWFMNFSQDGSVGIDQGQEVFVQWRQRFNVAMCETCMFYGVETHTIVSITNTNPAVVTYAAGASDDPTATSRVLFNVAGMTELNTGIPYSIRNVDPVARTFEVLGVDSTNFGAFTSGTFRRAREQKGIKHMDVTAGDTLVLYNGAYTSQLGVPGTRGIESSHVTKTVVQSHYQHRFPKLYGYNTEMADADRYDVVPGDWYYQNQLVPPGSDSSLALGIDDDAARLSVGTNFGWVPDEWMTFQLWIKLGPRGTVPNLNGDPVPVWLDSEFKLWGAREGQPQQLLHHYRPSTPGYFPLRSGPHEDVYKLGKASFFPYLTDQDGYQDHPRMTTWVAEVIVSSQFNEDPLDVVLSADINASLNVTEQNDTLLADAQIDVPRRVTGDTCIATAVVTTPSSGGGGTMPSWRTGLTVGQWTTIPNTHIYPTYIPNEPNGGVISDIVTGWNGFTRDVTRLWNCAGSGHSLWQNAVITIDLNADAPQWIVADQGSVFADVVENGAYYLDGRAGGRHQYYTQHFVPAGVCPDGKARVFLATAYALYSPSNPSSTRKVFGYRIADNAWDADGTWPDLPIAVPAVGLGQCQNPNTYEIYVQSDDTGADPNNNLAVFNPATGTWRRPATLPGGQSLERIFSWQFQPTLYDVRRNRIVAYTTATDLVARRLCMVDTTTGGTNAGNAWQVTNIALSPPAGAANDLGGLVHDLDNDRYLLVISNNNVDCKLYSIDPTTGAMTTLPTLTAGGLEGTDAILRKFHYVPELGGCILIRSATVDIDFFPTR